MVPEAIIKKLFSFSLDVVVNAMVETGKSISKDRQKLSKIKKECEKLGLNRVQGKENKDDDIISHMFSADNMHILATNLCQDNRCEPHRIMEEYFSSFLNSSGESVRDFRDLTNSFIEELVTWIGRNDKELAGKLYLEEVAGKNQELHERTYQEIRILKEQVLDNKYRRKVTDLPSLRVFLGLRGNPETGLEWSEQEMFPRDWVYESLRRQFTQTNAPLLLPVIGKAKTGKTMIASHLGANGFPVKAIFAFDNQSKEHRSVDRCIAEISAQIAAQIPAFLQALLKVINDETFTLGEGKDLFRKTLVQPLQILSVQERLLVVIDAIDEAGEGEKLLEYIEYYAVYFPDWIRFLITSRPTRRIITALKCFDSTSIDVLRLSHKGTKTAEFINDDMYKYCRDYLETSLIDAGFSETQREEFFNRLVINAEGRFDHMIGVCKNVSDDLRNRRLTNLSETAYSLPSKEQGRFQNTLERIFAPDTNLTLSDYNDFWREPIGIISVSPRPIPYDSMKCLMCWDDNELHDFVDPICELLDETIGNSLRLEPQIITSWFNSRSNPFYSSKTAGFQNFAKRCLDLYHKGRIVECEFLLCWFLYMLRSAGFVDEYRSIRDDEKLCESLQDLSEKFISSEMYEEAISLNSELRQLYAKEDKWNLGYQKRYAWATKDLAEAYEKNGQKNMAENTYYEALEIYREMSQIDSMYLADQAFVCSDLACLLSNKKDGVSEAESLYREALEIFRNLVKGDDYFEKAIVFQSNNLAFLLQQDDDAALLEAIELYRNALTISKNRLEKDSTSESDIEYTSAMLGFALVQTQDKSLLDEAEGLFYSALEILRRTTTENEADRWKIAWICNCLGFEVLEAKEEVDESEVEKLYREAYDIYSSYNPLPDEYVSDMADVCFRLAECLGSQSEDDSVREDEKLYQQAISLYKLDREIGLESWFDLAVAEMRYAELLCLRRDEAEIVSEGVAEALYRESRELWLAHAGNGHHYDFFLAIVDENLAKVLMLSSINDMMEVRNIYQESLESYRVLAVEDETYIEDVTRIEDALANI